MNTINPSIQHAKEKINMKCAEIMTPEPKMCIPDDKISVVARLMWDLDCGAVPVVENLESKKLVGMVTDRDIVMHVVVHGSVHPAQAKVADCMSSPPVLCRAEEPVEKAIELMGRKQVRRIPVVNENNACVGIISQADLLSRAANVETVIAVLRQISTPHGETKEVSEKSAAAEKASETTKEAPADKETKAKA